MSKYLLVTIGPVQSYIAQSRKTIDFFNSSKLIGDILKKILEKISSHLKGNEILLPNIDIKEYCKTENSIPNYFIVELIKEDNEYFNKIENQIENLYWQILYNIIEKIKNKNSLSELNKQNKKLNQHIKDIFDIYAVKVEVDNYKEAYNKLYEKLEMYKNIRCFSHYVEDGQEGEKGKKCSICGHRNSVFYKQIFPNDKRNKYNIEDNRLSEKEGICFSCYIKRFYDKKQDKVEKDYGYFPATIGIAVMGWENKINNKDILNEFSGEIKKALGDSELHPKSYYYKDVVLNEARKKNKEVKKCENVFEKYNEHLFSKYKPAKYYALIKCDIDDLGKWMSGKYLKNKNTTEDSLLNNQKNISKEIIKFGKSIEDIFKKKETEPKQIGRTIYTGGDDFLLFVTLEELFNVLELLDNGIQQINKNMENEYTRKLTISKSITVAHYTTPLQNVIITTTTALEKVKKEFEESEFSSKISKNATAITFITRSNTYRTTTFGGANNIYINDFKLAVKNFSENISKSFINQLEMNFKGFDAIIEYGEMLNMKKIFESEIVRILNRKNKDGNKKTFELKDTIMKLLNQGTIQLSNNYYELDYNNVFNFLHIADNISRELLKEN